MMKAGSMMFARAASKIVRRYCDCCGDELNAHQALSSGVCDRQRCREWKIEQVGAALLERRRGEIRDRLFAESAPSVAAVSAAIGADPASVVRAAVQWQARPVEPLPDERRAGFESHLRWIVDEAFAMPTPADTDADGERAALEAEEAPVLAAACSLCRGKCCDQGGRTAMLDEDDIVRWRAREPSATSEQAVAAYMACLPGETVAGSCVFLGAAGCALPRTMRNNWCNASQCKEREHLQGAVAEKDDAAVVMIADDVDREGPGAVGGWSPATGLVEVPVQRVGVPADPAGTEPSPGPAERSAGDGQG